MRRTPSAQHAHPITSWVQTVWGFETPHQWIRSMAHVMLSESEQTTPPISLQKVLKCRGISVRFDPHLETDGKLACDCDGFSILLNEKLRRSRSRARFTLAHELGHTLFYRTDSGKPCKAIPHSFYNTFEESLCN